MTKTRTKKVVDAMRKEDIIGDKEMSGLKYFVVSLQQQGANTKPSVLALLPGFLVSGKIQSSVKLAENFARQNDELIKYLVAVDAWGKDDEGSGTGCVTALFEVAANRTSDVIFFQVYF